MNTCTPTQAESPSDPYGPHPWDINFVLAVPPTIENGIVRLTPFIPRLHLDAFWQAGGSDPTLYQHMGSCPGDRDNLLRRMLRTQTEPDACEFLVVDKTKLNPAEQQDARSFHGAIAGIVRLVDTDAEQRVTEIVVPILKSSQRTHVASNTLGLLMNYALNLPFDPIFPGVGLRRVQWKCNSENAPSLAIAKRLGFQLEATNRWYRVMPEGSDHSELPGAADPVRAPGRHYVFLSMCWDFWERDGRAVVNAQMARRV